MGRPPRADATDDRSWRVFSSVITARPAGPGPPKQPSTFHDGSKGVGSGFILGLMIYLQSALAFTPFLADLVMLPSSATSVLGAWIGGRLVKTWGRVLSGTGMMLVLASMAGTLAMLQAQPATGVVLAIIPVLQLLSGLGAGLVVSPNHSMTLADVPSAQGSAASAIGQLGQRTSNNLGVAAASTAYYSAVYGSGLTLSASPAAVHLRAFEHTTIVSGAFLLLALAVVLLDRRHQLSVRPEAVALEREPVRRRSASQ